MIAPFNDFVDKYGLQNTATSTIKIKQNLSSLSLSDARSNLGDGPLEIDIGSVNLHPFESIPCVVYLRECFFDSYGNTQPNKLSELITKRKSNRLNSDYKIQGLTSERNSNCAAYFLYIIYLTKATGIDFLSTDLKLHYQRLFLHK